jgi:hypothetical protein
MTAPTSIQPVSIQPVSIQPASIQPASIQPTSVQPVRVGLTVMPTRSARRTGSLGRREARGEDRCRAPCRDDRTG